MLAAAPCSKTDQKESSLTSPLTLAVARHMALCCTRLETLDGSGAWSQTTASGNVPCFSRPCVGVLVFSWHGRAAGSVGRTRGQERQVDTEIGCSGSISKLDTESTAGLVAVGDRHEVAQAATSVR